MKNNQVLKIGPYSDNQLARLALRERLRSMLQFGRLSLKDGEAEPRYDLKGESGKGVITRADRSVVFEASLAALVESGEQVRLALVAYNRLLRERGILRFVRDNRDLRIVVNTFGNEVVLFGFDSRRNSRVQRYELARQIYLSEIGVLLTALPNKLPDAVLLGRQIEENFLKELEAAKGDAAKTAQLEKRGVELGILKETAVTRSKSKAKPAAQAASNQGKKSKVHKKSKWKRKPGAGANAQVPVTSPTATVADATPATPKKKKKKKSKNRKPKAVANGAPTSQPSAEDKTEAQS